MREVEWWWNGSWGNPRRDVWLQVDGEQWWVRVRIGRPESAREGVFPYPDEATAREQVELLLSEYGPWSRLSVGRRQTS